MNYAVAGGPIVGFTQHNESQLDRITRRLRASLRNIYGALNKRGKL